MSDPELLFSQGLEAFRKGDFYEAHDLWEEIWSDHKIDDKVFVQGLIQMAVACYHLTNDNLNGARGLFSKCLPKLSLFRSSMRGLDVATLVNFVAAAREQVFTIESPAEFDWDILPAALTSKALNAGK